jgi:hypothetical protein
VMPISEVAFSWCPIEPSACCDHISFSAGALPALGFFQFGEMVSVALCHAVRFAHGGKRLLDGGERNLALFDTLRPVLHTLHYDNLVYSWAH